MDTAFLLNETLRPAPAALPSCSADVIKGAARMFYIVDPAETTFEHAEDVPFFFRQAWPYFLAFLLLESVLLWFENKPVIRLSDGITSLSHGLFQECGRLVFRGAEHAAYIYIYNNFRLADLSWDSPITWYLAVIGVDFCYYWVHRACHDRRYNCPTMSPSIVEFMVGKAEYWQVFHTVLLFLLSLILSFLHISYIYLQFHEVHILWAQHQVHHSSEDFNLAVGLRQSVLQGWCSFVFYLPLALFIPPSHFLTHQQFNLLYQFWIHTETVKTLGPLEWVFNTPQHHRVHHGCNLYCLDKNYGGFLIIWDRIFGTFAEERKKEEIIYGLVYNQPTFNPLYLQVFYNYHVVDKFRQMSGWQNKLAAVWKGPSWLPGRPRLGVDEDKLDIRSRQKYDVKLPMWCNVYLILHFIAVVIGFQELTVHYMGMNPFAVLGFVAYILLSLTTIGMLFDNHPNACVFELARCLLFIIYIQKKGIDVEGDLKFSILQLFFILSVCFWTLKCMKVLQIKVKIK